MYRRRIKNAKKTLTEKLKIDQILMIFDSLLICVHRKERGGDNDGSLPTFSL